MHTNYSIHKGKEEKAFFYNLENLKNCNQPNKARFWYVGQCLQDAFSGFHCFMGWFKVFRDSCCFSTFWLGWRKNGGCTIT